MAERNDNLRADEMDELKHEIEMFMKEKERVRSILGRIGGVPQKSEKIVNSIFLAILIGSIAFSILYGGELRMLMVEFAVFLLSVKIIYLIHNQAKVNHFQLWILSSIEWRMNESSKKINQMHKAFMKLQDAKDTHCAEQKPDKTSE